MLLQWQKFEPPYPHLEEPQAQEDGPTVPQALGALGSMSSKLRRVRIHPDLPY